MERSFLWWFGWWWMFIVGLSLIYQSICIALNEYNLRKDSKIKKRYSSVVDWIYQDVQLCSKLQQQQQQQQNKNENRRPISIENIRSISYLPSHDILVKIYFDATIVKDRIVPGTPSPSVRWLECKPCILSCFIQCVDPLDPSDCNRYGNIFICIKFERMKNSKDAFLDFISFLKHKEGSQRHPIPTNIDMTFLQKRCNDFLEGNQFCVPVVPTHSQNKTSRYLSDRYEAETKDYRHHHHHHCLQKQQIATGAMDNDVVTEAAVTTTAIVNDNNQRMKNSDTKQQQQQQRYRIRFLEGDVFEFVNYIRMMF